MQKTVVMTASELWSSLLYHIYLSLFLTTNIDGMRISHEFTALKTPDQLHWLSDIDAVVPRQAGRAQKWRQSENCDLRSIIFLCQLVTISVQNTQEINLVSSHLCAKYTRINPSGMKDLLWLMVSEVSACGLLAPWLWTCDKKEHHGDGKKRLGPSLRLVF